MALYGAVLDTSNELLVKDGIMCEISDAHSDWSIDERSDSPIDSTFIQSQTSEEMTEGYMNIEVTAFTRGYV